jgi:hypothetical protein
MMIPVVVGSVYLAGLVLFVVIDALFCDTPSSDLVAPAIMWPIMLVIAVVASPWWALSWLHKKLRSQDGAR